MTFTLFSLSLASSVRTLLRTESICISTASCLCWLSTCFFISSIFLCFKSSSSLILLLFLVRFLFLFHFSLFFLRLFLHLLLPQGFSCFLCRSIFFPDFLLLMPNFLRGLKNNFHFFRLFIQILHSLSGNRPSFLVLLYQPIFLKRLQANPDYFASRLPFPFRRLSPVLPSAVISPQTSSTKRPFAVNPVKYRCIPNKEPVRIVRGPFNMASCLDKPCPFGRLYPLLQILCNFLYQLSRRHIVNSQLHHIQC